MKRICVLGCSGAGKTTLAVEIAARTGLPYQSLDAHYWRPGWVETPREVWRRTHAALIADDRWVIDGNYFSTLEDRLAAADAVVFLDPPRWRCLLGVFRRTASWWGRTRPEMGAGCPERLDAAFLRYIWNFNRDHRPKIIDGLKGSPATQIFHLRSSGACRSFLDGLAAQDGDQARRSPA